MTVWYYSDAQRNQLGPVEADALAQLHDAGQLAPEVLVWREGLPDWRPWREVMDDVLERARAAAAVPAPAGAAPAAGTTAPLPEAWTRGEAAGAPAGGASPYAPPRAVVDTASTFVAGGHVVYAGFWKRVAAIFIDGLVVSLAFYAVLVVLMVGGLVSLGALGGDLGAGGGASFLALMVGVYLTYPLISGLYYVGMESSPLQATLGKMAVGIKVTDTGGRRLGRGRALGRWASHLACYFTLYIGYVMAAFTARKQGLHDMAASTLVVDRWAFTAHPERQRTELGTVAAVLLVMFGLLAIGYLVLMAFAFAAGSAQA